MIGSIEWHKVNLENQKITLEYERKLLREQQDRVSRMEANTGFYQYQIEEAEKLGKNSFDRERFKVKK